MLSSDHPLNRQPFTANCAQPVKTLDFQKELTRLFGVHGGTGKPWVRIIWAQSNEKDSDGEWLAKTWSEYGAGGLGEWRRSYLYSAVPSMAESYDEARKIHLAREVWEDVSPPRYVLEKLIPPEVACLGWDDHLTPIESNPNFAEGKDADGDPLTARKPVRGYYVPIEVDDRAMIRGGVLAEHHNNCCAQAKIENAICYGSYAAPGDDHLEIARRLAKALQEVKERRPGISTQEELADASRRSAQHHEAFMERFQNRIRQIAEDAYETHSGGMLSDSPTAQKWGKFHFLSNHNLAGTPKKEKTL